MLYAPPNDMKLRRDTLVETPDDLLGPENVALQV